MKNKPNIITVNIYAAIFAAFLTALSGASAQVPQLINYQGRVAVGTTNFNSPPNGQFKFALVNAVGTTVYWANSPDTAPADGVPDTAVSLTVTKRLYSVLLGDTSVVGMPQAIPASVWANPDVRLRVWFNDGTTGFQLLSPDQRLAPNGYLPDGGVSSAAIASNAITSAKIASGAITSAKIAAGAVESANIAAGAIVNGDINSSAAIADTKLATIATPGKVADTALSANIALLNSAQTFTADKGFSTGSQLLADIGLASAPGLSFNGDSNTGIFQPSTNANVVAIATLGVERLRVDSTGRVGIGTTTPANGLTLQTPTSTYGLEHTDGSIRLGTYVGGVTNGGYLGTITNHKLSFFTNDGGASMTVDTTGNVGIGTSSPATPLHVTGGWDASLSGGGYIMAGSISAQNVVIDSNEIMARDNGERASLYLNNFGGSLVGGSHVYIGGGCFLLPAVDDWQLLGSPSARWQTVYAANGTIQTSDARLKDNIQLLRYRLQTVLSLRPVSYQWKKRRDDRVHLGLIAQEVEEIVPDAIVKDANSELPLGMNYSSFIPILIKAAQEQQALIDGQRAEILELKKRLDAVERILESVEHGEE